uniref:Uncharacterized protein n=1 Tax=Sciurus vulgaris TaxID=55149 RepID=A0A8D2DJS0_SCIVU
VVPFPVIGFLLSGFHFDGAGAHVKQQVQIAIEKFHSKEVNFCVLLTPSILSLLGLAVSEEDQAIGLSGAEVKGDRAHSFGVPLGQADVSLWGLKVDGVQCGHILTLEYNFTIDFHFCVPNPCQTRQLQTDVIILINNLSKVKHTCHMNQSCKQYPSITHWAPRTNIQEEASGHNSLKHEKHETQPSKPIQRDIWSTPILQ